MGRVGRWWRWGKLVIDGGDIEMKASWDEIKSATIHN